MNFDMRLKELMRDKGVTGYRMAQDTGISASLIGYWRRGDKLPGAENLKKLATYFGTTVSDLLGEEEPSEEHSEIYDHLLKEVKKMGLTSDDIDLLLSLARTIKERDKKSEES